MKKKILIVKTTSMGDIVHALPVVADIKQANPEIEIDWLVEESFADIVREQLDISEVITCAVRRWKKNIKDWAASLNEIKELKRKLANKKYDLVIDLQGLIKSAILSKLAGAIVSGYDASSIKEPLASLFYDKKYSVPKKEKAVERCRLLASSALGYTYSGEPKYSFYPYPQENLEERQVIFFCNASRVTKLWPMDKWINLGIWAVSEGYSILLPWGNETERKRANEIAEGVGPHSVVLPRLTISQIMQKISTSRVVIGLDTGFTHLSASMGKPTVALYRDYPKELVPLEGNGKKMALGGVGCCPSVEEVKNAFVRVTNESV